MPPHPINMKGYNQLRVSNRSNTNFFFHFYLFFSNLNTLFFSRLHGVWVRPSWPAEPRTTQGALALTGSLPGECLLDLRRALRRNRSDRPTKLVWPDLAETLQGSSLRAARSSAIVCWSRIGVKTYKIFPCRNWRFMLPCSHCRWVPKSIPVVLGRIC